MFSTTSALCKRPRWAAKILKLFILNWAWQESCFFDFWPLSFCY